MHLGPVDVPSHCGVLATFQTAHSVACLVLETGPEAKDKIIFPVIGTTFLTCERTFCREWHFRQDGIASAAPVSFTSDTRIFKTFLNPYPSKSRLSTVPDTEAPISPLFLLAPVLNFTQKYLPVNIAPAKPIVPGRAIATKSHQGGLSELSSLIFILKSPYLLETSPGCITVNKVKGRKSAAKMARYSML